MRHAIDHVEVFPAPDHVTEVRFTTEELTSVCPITGQPDISSVEIVYVPGEWCVESKSLKLYLWGFRDRPVFAEALAAEIAGEIFDTAKATSVTVTLTQRPRGGITISATAARVYCWPLNHGSPAAAGGRSAWPRDDTTTSVTMYGSIGTNSSGISSRRR